MGNIEVGDRVIWHRYTGDMPALVVSSGNKPGTFVLRLDGSLHTRKEWTVSATAITREGE